MHLHSACITGAPSIWKTSFCDLVPYDPTALHDELDALKFGDIGQGVPCDGDQIGILPFVDRPDLILPTQHLGINGRRALDCPHGCQSAMLHQRLQLKRSEEHTSE